MFCTCSFHHVRMLYRSISFSYDFLIIILYKIKNFDQDTNVGYVLNKFEEFTRIFSVVIVHFHLDNFF